MTTQAIDTRQERAARRSLARSAAYQLLSQATIYPSRDALAALREEDLPHARDAAALLPALFSTGLEPLEKELRSTDADALQAEHRRIFSHILSLDCPPCETVYTAQQIYEETQQLADIAGFFRAFGVQLAEKERVDHISVELEFMQFLTFKEGYALLNHGPAKARLCRQTQRTFMQDHLGRWALQFAKCLAERAGGGYFAGVASLVDSFVSNEISFLRAHPEAITVSSDWRTKASDDACPTDEECPIAESGGSGAH